MVVLVAVVAMETFHAQKKKKEKRGKKRKKKGALLIIRSTLNFTSEVILFIPIISYLSQQNC